MAFQVPDISDESACDTDYNLVVAKVVQIVSVHKQLVSEFDIEAFNVLKVDYVAFTEKYQVKYHIGLHCV